MLEKKKVPTITLPSIALPNLANLFPKITLPEFPTLRLPPNVVAAVGSLMGDRVTQQMQALGEAAARFQRELESLEPAARTLGERGWTVPLLTDPHTMRAMIQHGSLDNLDSVFVRHYASEGGKRTEQLFKDLAGAEQLEHWRPLLKQAMASYRRRQYLLVVPSLLLIFEGAIANAMGALQRKSPTRASASRKRSEARGAVERLIWVSLDGFVGEVFRDHYFGAPRPLRVNRHWIMHGRDRPDWNRADCLRLFQAIHTLAA